MKPGIGCWVLDVLMNQRLFCMFTVYAIEASDMAEHAKLVVKANKMEDRITVVHGKVEVRPKC